MVAKLGSVPGQHFIARVVIDNRSHVPLATAAPWPCLLTYRWLSAWSGAVVVEHGFHSILQPPAWPNAESAYALRVIAPNRPGEYVLRATVIQEGWRWLDALPPPVRADAAVRVISAGRESLVPTPEPRAVPGCRGELVDQRQTLLGDLLKPADQDEPLLGDLLKRPDQGKPLSCGLVQLVDNTLPFGANSLKFSMLQTQLVGAGQRSALFSPFR